MITAKLTPSKYQSAIYHAIQNRTENLIVEAVAGSGKTTTIVEALNIVPKDQKILFLAFNRHVIAELKKRVAKEPNIVVSTINGYGWSCCLKSFGRVVLDAKKTERILDQISTDIKSMAAANRMIALMKSSYSEIKWDKISKLNLVQELELLSEKYDIGMPTKENNGEIVTDPNFIELLMMTFAKSVEIKGMMDFNDQIFMPVYYGIEIKKYDLVLVDEAQDLTPTQIELVAMAGKRVVAVGDTNQAIYGFRGADTEAMSKFKARLNMSPLPLSICYRCPKSHVALASEIVSHIESAENAPEGIVTNIAREKFFEYLKSGDMVLCRTNAPLVESCMDLIGLGVKAIVRGIDFSSGLLTLIKKLSEPDHSVNVFLDNLQTYKDKEIFRLERRKKSTTMIRDKCKTLRILCKDSEKVIDVILKIKRIFSDDDNPGVIFSSVHRAKGLEKDRIFILRPDLMPFFKAKQSWEKIQELNLKYVALTRAKKELIFIHEAVKEKSQNDDDDD